MPPIQHYISINDREQWESALTGIKHAFAHTWDHNYAMYLTTGYPTHLYYFQDATTKIVCPIAERSFDGFTDIVTPYGFSGFVGDGEQEGFADYWKNFAADRGFACGYIGLNPLFENNTYWHAHDVHQQNHVYVLDLTLSMDDLFARLHTNRKRQLRNWENWSARLVSDKEVLHDFFQSNYHKFFTTKNASPSYNFSLETISHLLSLHNTLVVGAGMGEAVQSVSVFAHTHDVADYLFSVCLPEASELATHLLWSGITQLKSLNIPLLNLGGGISEGDGVAQFKKRFGATKLPLKCLKQIYSQKKYEHLCAITNTSPAAMEGFFPPYRSSAH
jgi:hypothetical protein